MGREMATAAGAPAEKPGEETDRPAMRGRRWRRALQRVGPLSIIAILIAALVAAPILSVAAALFGETSDLADQVFAILLPRYLANTALLLGLVAIGVTAIGVGAAWLVTLYRFPGRPLMEMALALPLAFPAYVLAYAYTDLLDHPGLVQTWLRSVTGWGPRDYWFPEIRSLEGAAAMLTLVLYPYVYLLARAAFVTQAASVLEVSRTLGAGPWGAFVRVALPMARPAIFTGAALAMMETLADYGTVAHFGVETLATGVYRAWFAIGDRIAAAQLSGWLLIFVLVVLVFERLQRRARRFQTARGAYGDLAPQRLTGWRAVGAILLCGAPVLFGFALPLVVLIGMSAAGGHQFFGATYLTLAANSLTLASAAAALTVGLALVIGYAARRDPSLATRAAATAAGLGYAVPGSVIAVGVLIPLAALDNTIDAWLRAQFGVSSGLILTGSIAALLFAYAVRFMSVALNTVEASLSKITPSMDDASRILGQGEWRTLWRVHLPMMRGGVLTAALIVFVDVMKELPATLILSPFDFRTLAVQAHRLASDERLLQASTPSLAIVAVGLIPVLLLAREIRHSRPGARRERYR